MEPATEPMIVDRRLNPVRALSAAVASVATAAVLVPSAHFAAPVPPDLFRCADDGLEVTVWAQSPMLLNPTNLDIDRHGRVWVAEGVNYRKNLGRQPEGDRIMVLEDTDGDGAADKSWVFVQEEFLRAPMGVAVIGNQVVVSMAPDLIVYTDVDGDAVFDPEKGDTREVLLTGFNGRNHDHSLHSVTVGPDGKWYFSVGNCGALFTDNDGSTWRIGAGSQTSSWWPKDPDYPDKEPSLFGGMPSDDGRVYVGGFIARMNPDGTGVEVLAHNLRNSYENTVTSLGDVFAADNDDRPACRTFGLLEGGNYGFASRDGSRTWQADRRPGQGIETATWRQEDPGVAPAGDIYGGGAPTGIVFYENGALGREWDGTLLLCEPARNTVFGYRPERQGEGWKLDRFDFLTTNPSGDVVGTDYSGGNETARADDTKTLFRPSDIAVGPDGALYIADWYDPRVGGHADLDDSLAGTIYRVAPKGFESEVPEFDLATPAGVATAIKSPAVHVRALGQAAVKSLPSVPSEDEIAPLVEGENKYVVARFYWAAGALGAQADGHREAAGALVRAEDLEGGRRLAERFASLTEPPSERSVAELASDGNALDPADRAALEAWGMACEGREAEVYEALLAAAGGGDPRGWTGRFAALAWRLHPPASVAAFKARAMEESLPERARRDALTAIGFNTSPEAIAAMLEVAEKSDGPVRSTAVWWLLNKKDNDWSGQGLEASLKERGIYDPEKVELVAVALPEPLPATFSSEDALALAGDVARGEVVSQRCLMCHRIGDQGVDYGPDMTSWARTQPAETVVHSIVEPSADLTHGYYGSVVETTDGTLIEGMLINEADPLVVQSMGGFTQMVPRSRIKEVRQLDRSLMMTPAQLGLTAQDVADVTAYLKSL